MSAEYSFSSLLFEHDELEAMFEKHQRALVARDIDAALAAITTFENALNRHIDFEDQVVLPLYVAKKAETEGGTLAIFNAEHRKLHELAGQLTHKTSSLYNSPDILGAVLKLLDDEALFKGLFNHHAQREKNLLFPRLDACTTEFERKRALSRCA